MKNLATPSFIFIFVFSSFTGELCSQPIRGNDRRLGRMFPEHAERRFLDPEYSFDEYFQLGSRRKVGSVKNQLASPNTSNYVCEETFPQLRTGLTLSFYRCNLLIHTRIRNSHPISSNSLLVVPNSYPAQSKSPRSTKQSPCTIEQSPRSTEKSPCTIEQSPRSTEQSPRTTEQSPRSIEQSPRTTEQSPCSIEQSSCSIEQSPHNMEQSGSRFQETNSL